MMDNSSVIDESNIKNNKPVKFRMWLPKVIATMNIINSRLSLMRLKIGIAC